MELWNNEREPVLYILNPSKFAFGYAFEDKLDADKAAVKKRLSDYSKEDKDRAYRQAIKRAKREGLEPPAADQVNDYDSRKRIVQWITCRDYFLNEQQHLEHFYFEHDLPKGRGRSIAVFIGKVEDRLNLPEDQRARFRSTSKRHTIKVTPGPFWNAEPHRRSLFSALLRCGCNYRIHKDNFKKALYSRLYTSETKEAVERFLAGNVHYKGEGSFNGWQAEFSRKWIANYQGRKAPPMAKLLEKLTATP